MRLVLPLALLAAAPALARADRFRNEDHAFVVDEAAPGASALVAAELSFDAAVGDGDLRGRAVVDATSAAPHGLRLQVAAEQATEDDGTSRAELGFGVLPPFGQGEDVHWRATAVATVADATRVGLELEGELAHGERLESQLTVRLGSGPQPVLTASFAETLRLDPIAITGEVGSEGVMGETEPEVELQATAGLDAWNLGVYAETPLAGFEPALGAFAGVELGR